MEFKEVEVIRPKKPSETYCCSIITFGFLLLVIKEKIEAKIGTLCAQPHFQTIFPTTQYTYISLLNDKIGVG